MLHVGKTSSRKTFASLRLCAFALIRGRARWYTARYARVTSARGMEAPLYPVSLEVKDRRCLVVGGGGVALRKVQGLVE